MLYCTVVYCTVQYCTVLAVSECHDAVMEEDWTRKNLNIMQELTVLSLYIILTMIPLHFVPSQGVLLN